MVNLIKHNRGFRYAAILVLVQFLVILALVIFRVGGDDFIANLVTVPTPLYAAIAMLAVCWGWLTSNSKEVSKRIWGWMFLGLFLWTIAEVLWVYYSLAYQEPLPFPSPADFFWVIGTFPLVIAFIIRLRSFQFHISRPQTVMLVLTNAIFIILSAIFIFPQMFVNANPARWVETAINVFYSVTDLLMFGLSLGIIFAMQRGRLSTVWSFILWSNIIRTIADLLFTYASWNRATLSANANYTITVLYNIPFLTSYLLIALGMLANQILIKEESQVRENTTHPYEIPYSLALFFTNSQNQVITTSDNISAATFAREPKDFTGLPLYALLGADAQVIARMILECRQKGYLSSYPIEIRNARQKQVHAWVTAVRDGKATTTFNGLNILLRVKTGDLEMDELKGQFQSIAQRVLLDTGRASRENILMLKSYFSAQILGLYRLVNSMAGGPAAQYLLDNFNQTAEYNHWAIKASPLDVTVPDGYDEELIGRSFRQLLKIVKGYAVDMTSAQVVADEIKKAERGLNSRTIGIANDFGLRSSTLSFRSGEVDYKTR